MAGSEPNRAHEAEPVFTGLQLLDDLIRESFDKVKREFEAKPKLGEWLKMLEVRAKLSPKDASHREMWKLLEEVRQEILKPDKPESKATASVRRRRRTSAPKKSRKND